MNRLQSSRVILAMACGAAWLGAAVAADRSPAAMAEASNRFLGALTQEQRGRAAFAFASPEREHWGFDPTEFFPRQGLPMNEMSEPQRKLAHDLLKSGLSERGYQTATAIMDRETIVKALESAARVDPARGSRPLEVLRLGLRHAVASRRVGLAHRRESSVAQLHGRRWLARGVIAGVLRRVSSHRREWDTNGAAAAFDRRGHGTRAVVGARRSAARQGDCCAGRAERHLHERQGDSRTAQ